MKPWLFIYLMHTCVPSVYMVDNSENRFLSEAVPSFERRNLIGYFILVIYSSLDTPYNFLT